MTDRTDLPLTGLPLAQPALLSDDPHAADVFAACPGLSLQYHYAHMPLPAGRGLWLRLAISPAQLALPATPEDPASQARADANRWQGLVRALASPRCGLALACSLDAGAPHALDLAPWRAFAEAGAAWFEARAAGQPLPPPPAQQLAVALEPSNPLDLFELVVELVLSLPSGESDGAAPARRLVHRPAPGCAPGGALGLQSLARMADLLEAAAADPGCVLKLARGSAAPDATQDLPPLWVLRVCQQPQAPVPRGLRWTVQSVRHFAPVPLALELLSRSAVPVPVFDVQQGMLTTASMPTTFTSLDLDALARSALGALDGLLAPPSVNAMALLDTAGQPTLEAALQAVREDLADAIAQTLQPVMAPTAADPRPDPHNPDEAAWQLRQGLRWQADQAYALGALCQVAVQLSGRLEAPRAGQGAPRLRCRVLATDAAGAQAGTAPAPLEATAQGLLHNGRTWVNLPFCPPEGHGRAHLRLGLQVLPEGVDWPDPAQLDRLVHRLQLLRPFQAGLPALALPPIDLPLPWRQALPAPTLAAQRSQAMPLPAVGAAAIMAAAGAWRYEVEVSAPPAAQDRLHIALHPGRPESSAHVLQPSRAALTPDLLDHLACWAQLWPALGTALQQALQACQAAPADGAALQRARTLAADTLRLLRPLAPAWRAWCAAPAAAAQPVLPAPAPADPAEDARQVGLAWSEQHQADGVALQLRTAWQTDALAAWRVVADPAGALPCLQLAATDGADSAIGLIDPVAATGELKTPSPAYASVHALPWRRVSLSGLSVLACPRLSAQAQLTRNEALLHDADGQPLVTAPAFVYRGPAVPVAAPITVLLRHDRRLDIAELSMPRQQTLAGHLVGLLTQLGVNPPGPTGFWLRLELVFAGAPVAVGGVPVVATVPVFLLPNWDLAAKPSSTDPPLAQQLAEAVRQWYREHQPGAGEFALEFDLLTQRDGLSVPVWHWRGLYLATGDITDLVGPLAG